MTSIRGLLISHMIWKNMNHNAPHKKHSAARHRWQNAYFPIKTACQKPTPGLQRPHQAALPFNVSSVQTPDVPDVYSYIFMEVPTGTAWCPSYRNFSTRLFSSSQWLPRPFTWITGALRTTNTPHN